MPSGRGRELLEAMYKLTEELRTAVPAAFESDNYRNRRQALEDAAGERQVLELGLRILTGDAAGLRRLFEADGGLLVVAADAPWFTPSRVDQIIKRARVPVILQTDVAPETA